MRIVVVSDTHRDFDRLYRLALVEKGRTDLFVHLGDGEQELDDLRAAFPGLALLSVRGNCDLFSTAPDHLLFEEGGIRLFAATGTAFRYGTVSTVSARLPAPTGSGLPCSATPTGAAASMREL